jgi:outer membrane protein assembly factor BamB
VSGHACRWLSVFLACLLVPLVGAGSAGAHSSGWRLAATDGCTEEWWPQPRQNACGNSSASNPTAPSPTTVARLTLAWTYASGAKGTPRPVVAKAVRLKVPYVYFAGRGHMLALDLVTGRLRWTANAEASGRLGPRHGAQPVADRDVLLQGAGLVLRRYWPWSGHVVWKRTLSRWCAFAPIPPLVADGNLYCMASGVSPSVIEAFNERTGRQVWKRWFGCWTCGLAVSGGRLYVAGDPNSDDGRPGALYALDAKTGETLWSAHSSKTDYSHATPAIAAGRVFVYTQVTHAGATSFAIEARSQADGHLLWQAPVTEANGAFWLRPVSANARLVAYRSADGVLYALDAATGALRWKAAGIEDAVQPAIVNDLVWAGESKGRLVALDARNGNQLWASPQLWESSPSTAEDAPLIAIAGSVLLLGTPDGRLRAYQAP